MFGLALPCALAIVDQVSDTGALLELESGVFLDVDRQTLPLRIQEGDTVLFRVPLGRSPPHRFSRFGWIAQRSTRGQCGPRNPGVHYEFEMPPS